MASVAQLWTKNRPLARGIAREYFIPGSDADDVAQEALIGLWVAATDYDASRGTFKAFAALVIHRRLQSCIKIARARKHEPLNFSLRALLDDQGKPQDVCQTLPYLHQVVDIAEDRARLSVIIEAMENLSDFERHCVLGVASGHGYIELGDPKRVDNALNRARRKLKAAVETV